MINARVLFFLMGHRRVIRLSFSASAALSERAGKSQCATLGDLQ